MNPTLTLPGDIPGLLRRGSPVLDRGSRGIYLRPDRSSNGQAHRVALDYGALGSIPLPLLALDLTDATGRAHAAWWAIEQQPRALRSANEEIIVARACRGASLQAADLAALRDLVLRLAGRTA